MNLLIDIISKGGYVMLYTTYFANIDKVPNDCINLAVTRFPPKWINQGDSPHIAIVKELSPSKELLLQYKEDDNWEEYIGSFNAEMINRKDMVAMLQTVKDLLDKGKSVCFTCYEKDYSRCHRSLLGRYFQDKGYEWTEI